MTSSSVAHFSTASPASYSFTDVVAQKESQSPYRPWFAYHGGSAACKQDIHKPPQTEIGLPHRTTAHLLWHGCWSQQGMIDERRNING